MSAAYSLFSSQESRDRYMILTNPPDTDDGTKEPIIDTSVLQQSDMGILKTLTLYHDLCHPLFNDGYHPSSSSSRNRIHKLNIHEFMMGCGWALEQFYRTREELLIKRSSLGDLYNVGTSKKHSSCGEIYNVTTTKEEILSIESDIRDVYRTASQDPTSIEYDFIKMATPMIFVPLGGEGFTRRMMMQSSRRNGRKEGDLTGGGMGEATNPTVAASAATATTTKTTPLFKFENIRVMNVALLSARVEEIYPPPRRRRRTTPLSSPSSPFSEHGKITKKEAQVITQLEILYELQQSVIKHGGNNDETKNYTTTLLMVGTFEACLEGDPNRPPRTDAGEDDNAMTTTNHEWKLASYRPATEFYNT